MLRNIADGAGTIDLWAADAANGCPRADHAKSDGSGTKSRWGCAALEVTTGTSILGATDSAPVSDSGIVSETARQNAESHLG